MKLVIRECSALGRFCLRCTRARGRNLGRGVSSVERSVLFLIGCRVMRSDVRVARRRRCLGLVRPANEEGAFDEACGVYSTILNCERR